MPRDHRRRRAGRDDAGHGPGALGHPVHQWLLHLPVPAGEDPASWDPEPAMFEAVGERFDYEIIERSRWTPRAMVASKWRERNDRLGHGFTLLRVRDSGRSGGALIDEAATRAVPFTVVDLDANETANAYDGFELLLVRPDQHVGWRSHTEPSPDDARAVIDRVTGTSSTAAASQLSQQGQGLHDDM